MLRTRFRELLNAKDGQVFSYKTDENNYTVVYLKKSEFLYTTSDDRAEKLIKEIEHLFDWKKVKSIVDMYQRYYDDYKKVKPYLAKASVAMRKNGNYRNTLTDDKSVFYLMKKERVQGKDLADGVAYRQENDLYLLDCVYSSTIFFRFKDQESLLYFFELTQDLLPYESDKFFEVIKRDKETIPFIKSLFERIENGERDIVLDKNIFYRLKLSKMDFGNEEEATLKKEVYQETYEKLHNMIGLENIKTYMNRMLKIAETDQRFEKMNMKIKKSVNHAVFVGNAGTGKTEVARLFADFLWSMGIIRERKLVEVSKEELTDQYVGGTEQKVSDVIQEALGGVLFVDEAYMLADDGRGDSNGKKALEMIMRAMENHRDDLTVIFAGYDNEMDDLLDMNQGLRSRFVHRFEFFDYNISELEEILFKMIQAHNFDIAENRYLLKDVLKAKSKNGVMSGNARDLRKISEEIVDNHKISFSDSKTSAYKIRKEDVLSVIEKKDSRNQEKMKESLELAKAKLNQLIGLTSLKKEIEIWSSLVQIKKERTAINGESSKPNLHMTFEGNAGTGKTTVARIIGEILKANGLLSRGHFKEVSRADMVGEYQGQTAIKVKKLIKESIGGILFIDEAYSLAQNENDTFGKEAIDTLIAEMENNREDLVVILAGYSKDIDKLLDTNQSFKSRISNRFVFPDYTATELFEVLKMVLNQNQFKMDEETLLLSEKYIIEKVTNSEVEGNARWIRNLFEKLERYQSVRLTTIDIDKRDYYLFTKEDLEEVTAKS